MPSRPPSPAGETPDTLPSSVFLPVRASTLVIVPWSRETTSRLLSSGSGATPHGVFRPVATVRSTLTEPLAGGAFSAEPSDGDAFAVGLPAALPSPPAAGPSPPPPEEQPAVSSSAVAASTAGTARRSTILVLSGGGPAAGSAGSTCLTPLAPRRFPINRTRPGTSRGPSVPGSPSPRQPRDPPEVLPRQPQRGGGGVLRR